MIEIYQFVTVDGISYEYLGTGSTTLPSLPNLLPATPLTVSYDSQYSNFTFSAGPVEVTASFLSPVLPKDYCRTSIPLSYLNTSMRSTDNFSHSVQFYSDVDASWVAYESNVTTQWQFYDGSALANGSVNSTGQATSSIYSWYSLEWKERSNLADAHQVHQLGNALRIRGRERCKDLTLAILIC